MRLRRTAADVMVTIPSSSRSGGSAPVFYGWWVVLALFVMLGTSSGLGFYNQSVLLEALTREHGFSVARASLAPTFFFGASGLFGLLVAWLIDRHDPRWTICGGAVLSATALVLIGRIDSLAQLYFAFAIFGCGFSAASLVPGTTLVTRWFVARRSFALALMTTGLSVGGIVLTPIASRVLQARGLRDGTPLLAALLLLCVVPLTLALVRRSPAALGLDPDGASTATPGPATALPPPPSIAFSDAVRTRFFIGLSVAFLFALAAQVGGLAHHFSLVTSVAGQETARLAVSLLATGSIVGRFMASFLVRHLPIQRFTVGLLLAQGLMLVNLGRIDDAGEALVASAAFGLTVGSALLMQPLLVAEAFGITAYARLYSITSLVAALGVTLGPTLLGLLYDLTGGYDSAFLAMLGFSLLGALALVLAGPIEAPRRQLSGAAAHPGSARTDAAAP
ncbi:MAG: MFS transporter [Acidobacteria bacterium]|nr:MAG: MFS transporter [Acidobacteriota bacterium]REK06360.1 MAG: MFS transporter [Acidobacteriota bacterium]